MSNQTNNRQPTLALRTQLHAGYITCARSAQVLKQDCDDKYPRGSSDWNFCNSKIDRWAEQGCPYPAPDR